MYYVHRCSCLKSTFEISRTLEPWNLMEINASGDNDVTACDGLPSRTLQILLQVYH